jgi:hypothetical protein
MSERKQRRKPAHIRTTDVTPLSVRFPPDLRAALKAAADADGRTEGGFVKRAVAEKLAQMKKPRR